MKLETQRLILRKPRESDWKDLVDGLNNMNTLKFLSTAPSPYTKKSAKYWVDNCLKEWKKKDKEKYYFFIELKKEKKIIGAIDIFKFDKINQKCETASWLNERYRRNGFMSEAKIAINEFTFNKLKIRKMETDVFAMNKASKATQESVGYKYEGRRIKSQKSLATGKIHDLLMFGLLKSDWKKHLPKLKKKLKEKYY